MSERNFIVSDVSGQVIDTKDQAVRLTVLHHAGVQQPVRIDTTAEELRAMLEVGRDAVLLTVESDDPGLPAHVILDREDFELQFKGDALSTLQQAQAIPQQRRSGGVKGVDYRLPENAGKLHRGQITEEEKEFVRNNLDQANANRRSQGRPEIDVNDARERERYGFDDVETEAAVRPSPRRISA